MRSSSDCRLSCACRPGSKMMPAVAAARLATSLFLAGCSSSCTSGFRVGVLPAAATSALRVKSRIVSSGGSAKVHMIDVRTVLNEERRYWVYTGSFEDRDRVAHEVGRCLPDPDEIGWLSAYLYHGDDRCDRETSGFWVIRRFEGGGSVPAAGLPCKAYTRPCAFRAASCNTQYRAGHSVHSTLRADRRHASPRPLLQYATRRRQFRRVLSGLSCPRSLLACAYQVSVRPLSCSSGFLGLLVVVHVCRPVSLRWAQNDIFSAIRNQTSKT